MDISEQSPFAPKPAPIVDYECEIGEGPLWHPTERRLYWSDIITGRPFRYGPETCDHEKFYDGEVVGGFTIQSDGSLVLFMDRGTIKRWHDGEMTTIVEEIPAERDSRFNDVIADPAGRVFCGTMSTEDRLGRLYRLDRDGSVREVLDGINLSNGLGFSPDAETLFYTES